MTIDEAIEHAKKVARTCYDGQCAADHMQLAEWLRRARGAEAMGRWYNEKLGKAIREQEDMLSRTKRLRAENERLRAIARAHAATLECCGCDCCPHECDQETVPMRDGCAMRDELQELGVIA